MTAAASTTANRRIQKELKSIENDSECGFKITLVNGNLLHWKTTLAGVEGSPYEGGVFGVEVKFPLDYPFTPPKVRFTTKIYHCNINSQGGICLDILKDQWSPGLTISKLLISLRSFMIDSNPLHPLVPDIARELRTNKARHDETAREWTLKYAMSEEGADNNGGTL